MARYDALTDLPNRTMFRDHLDAMLKKEENLAILSIDIDEFKQVNSGQAEARLEAAPRRDMVGNFVDVIRGGGPLHCNVDLGCATMITIKLAVESYRQKKTMLWDPKSEKLVS